MADNVPVTPGSGAEIATDDVAGVQFQKVKFTLGDSGVDDGLVSATNPLPVTGSVSGSVSVDNFPATQPVSAAALPLPTGASTEAKQDAIIAKMATPQTGMPLDTDDYLPVLTIPAFSFRCGFDSAVSGSVDTDFLTPIVIGTGMTVNQTAGNLVVTEGTTASSETILRSVTPFSGNIVARASVTLSQRNANNDSIIELVDVIGDGLAFTINSTTSVTVTKTAHGFTAKNVGQSMEIGALTGTAGTIPGRYAIASVPTANTINFTVAGWPAAGSGTCSVFGWNFYRLDYNGATATSMNFACQRNGYQTGPTAVTINTTATGHVPTFSGSDGEFMVSDQAGASSTTIELTRRGSSIRNVPLNETQLYLQIRAKNGTVAPTATTWTVGFVDVGNCVTQNVTIQNISPQSANTGLPVEILAALPTGANVIGSLGASGSTIGDAGLIYRSTSGGASGAHIVSAATTNATNAKGAAGRLVGWSLGNTTANWQYVKIHNTAGVPTPGAGVVRTIAIPPNGVSTFKLEGGTGFSTGIGYSIVTGSADADATATTLGAVVGDLYFA